MQLAGKVAVVTGAGSGIGRAMSQELAARGALVVACDIQDSAAAETVVGLAAPGNKAASHLAMRIDVADEESFRAAADTVDRELGGADILVNNAGVLGQVAAVDQLTTAEMRWVVDIDLWGVVNGTRAFLPQLKRRPSAALVNVSSLAGLMGSLGNSAYFAAKFGVRGFSEAVRAELQSTGVTVTIVFPGIVRTNLGASHPGYTEEERLEAVRRYNRQPGLSPEQAARKIVAGIERGKARVLVGPDAWAVDKLVRLFPGNVDRWIHPVVARLANRQRPDGRKSFS